VLKIGGWKTRAMLDRYNVLNEKRIQTAQERAGKYVAAKIASLRDKISEVYGDMV
jgi:hypothetical protein